jgi:hypothetical protein
MYVALACALAFVIYSFRAELFFNDNAFARFMRSAWQAFIRLNEYHPEAGYTQEDR